MIRVSRIERDVWLDVRLLPGEITLQVEGIMDKKDKSMVCGLVDNAIQPAPI